MTDRGECMPTVNDVYEYIDGIAPFAAQMDGDNSGLLVGDPGREVRSLCVCLDITRDTLAAAREFRADLIVCHHPVIYGAQTRFLKGDLPYELAAAGISAICAHTSLDCAADGVNDVLADLFGLTRVEAVATEGCPVPLARVGFLPRIMTPLELADFTAERLNCKVRWCGGGRDVETLAVIGGSGGGDAAEIAAMGVGALVTGDAGYHHFQTAAHLGLTLVAAGHFETEAPVVPALAEKLQARFPAVAVTVLDEKNVIKYL